MLGDLKLQHMIEQGNWRKEFLHIIMRHDVVPRILLAKLKGLATCNSTCLMWFWPDLDMPVALHNSPSGNFPPHLHC